MTTTTPATALEGAALLLHLVDRCERGVALADEYRMLRAGIRDLISEVHRQVDAKVGILGQLGNAMADVHLIDGMRQANLEAAGAAIQRAERAEAEVTRLQAKARDLEAHLTIAHQNVRAMRDGGTP